MEAKVQTFGEQRSDYIRWDTRESDIAEARKAGMKEVVKWVQANASLERGDRDVGLCFEDYLHFDYTNWQAQLKKWGIG